MSNPFENAKFNLGDLVLVKQELAMDRYFLEVLDPNARDAGIEVKVKASEVWLIGARALTEDLRGGTRLEYKIESITSKPRVAAEAELELYRPKESV